MISTNKVHSNNYLIRQLPQATAFISLELEIIHVSDKWISDFSGEVETEMVGMNLLTLFANFDTSWQKVLDDSLNGEPGQPRIKSYISKDGTEKWFELLKTTWHDEDENVIGWILQAEKASLRAQNEVQLDKLHILSTEMSDIAKIGLWEYNVLQDKMHWSEMTKVIHEVSLDYIPNLEDATNFYKSGYSRNTIAMTIEKAIIGQISWSEKVQLVTANGKEIWVIVTGKPLLRNGEFIGLIGTIQNINELIFSEMKTKENEYHLRTLIDILPYNIFIKDKDSKKVLVNKSEMQFCGVKDESEILGKDDFAFYDKKMATQSRKDDLKVMHDLKPIIKEEKVHIMENGERKVMHTSKIPLVNADGSAYGLVGISMDITDLKLKEEKLQDLISVTSLQNKKLLNFAHIVSHNLRSHTANFSMLLDFLVNEKNETEQQKILGMLTKASDNLLETLDNLNEVVDINTKTGLEKKRLNLGKAVQTAQQNLTALLSEHNAKIITTIDDQVTVNVIPAYLDSILMNFISNAIKYQSSKRTPIIKLNAERKAKYTVLSIEDNGIGIDLKKYGDKLFGMYKTFHNNPDARGLGLYMTKNQIESMKGKIKVRSVIGKGTTFKIYFNEQD